MPDDEAALATLGQWRLLQALHNPRGGQLTRILAAVSDTGRSALRWPHPEVFQVLDPRPLLDDAARLAARYGGGLRNAEILAAGMANRADLWFGTPANVGPAIADGAVQLGPGYGSRTVAATLLNWSAMPRTLAEGGPVGP